MLTTPGGLHSLRWLITFLTLVTCLALGRPDLDWLQTLASERYGTRAARLVGEWRALIADSKGLDDAQRLVVVNDFFNDRIRWVQDSQAWGQKDYWATPLETMGRLMGDCEDFAIAKYATLVLAGVDVDKLRITYVKAQLGGPYGKAHVAHMVLAYYPSPSAEPMILDNLITDVRPASGREDLSPVFGFNSKGLWVGGAASPATADPGAKLSRWRDLLRRAAAEGLG